MESVFESVWLLLTVAGVSLIVVSVIRQTKPEWGYWPLLVPLAITALAFAVDAAVTTDSEAIHTIISSCKKAAITGDAKTLMTLVSPNYTDRSHRDRTALETAVQRALNNASIKKIKTQSFLLTLHPDTAESQLSVVVHLNNDSRYAAAGSVVFVEMELEFEKIGRKWYIRRADVVSINKNPMGWRDIS